jgi:hypothetical protein
MLKKRVRNEKKASESGGEKPGNNREYPTNGH